MTWKDLWEVLVELESDFDDDAFSARELLDALQKRVTEKMVEEL
jgi:hypothetical protein